MISGCAFAVHFLYGCEVIDQNIDDAMKMIIMKPNAIGMQISAIINNVFLLALAAAGFVCINFSLDFFTR